MNPNRMSLAFRRQSKPVPEQTCQPTGCATSKESSVMKIQDFARAELPMSAAKAQESPDLSALFDGHVAREFADQDVDATMETMIPEPYVYCVPVMTGGVGGRRVRRFYSEHFINQIPKDVKVTPISKTIGRGQIVIEFILSFTHDTQRDYLLPGILPTV